MKKLYKIFQKTKYNMRMMLCAILSIVTTLSSVTIPTSAYAAPSPSTWSFSFVGHYETWVCPETGYYQIEAYGASGGGCTSASGVFSGGYSKGKMKIMAGEKLYIFVGEEGRTGSGKIQYSFPDGGGGGIAPNGTQSYSAGGSSFATFDLSQSVNKLIAAGGGGGKNLDSFAAAPGDFTKGNSPSGALKGSAPVPQLVNDASAYSGPVNAPRGGGYEYADVTSSLSSQGYVVPGGTVSSSSLAQGYGGIGGYDVTKVEEYTSAVGGNKGNGSLKISYVGPITSFFHIICGSKDDGGTVSYGAVSGMTNEGLGKYKKQGTYGTSFVLPDATPPNPNWAVGYYTRNDDMSNPQKKYYVGDTIKYEIDDIFVTIHWKYVADPEFYELTPTPDSTGKITHKIHVNNINDGVAKYVKFQSSSDNGATWEDVNANGTSFSTSKTDKNFAYNGGVQTYDVLATGWYDIYAKGADGGSGYSNRSGAGAEGDYVQATVKLNYGDTLYFRVGGAGTDNNVGGGYPNAGRGVTLGFSNNSGYWVAHNGNGGGSTDVMRNQQTDAARIMSAGGGTGGGSHSTAYCGWGDSCGEYLDDRPPSMGRQYSWYSNGSAFFLFSNYSANGVVRYYPGSTSRGADATGEKFSGNTYGVSGGGERRCGGGNGGGWYGGWDAGFISNGISGVSTAAALQTKNVESSAMVFYKGPTKVAFYSTGVDPSPYYYFNHYSRTSSNEVYYNLWPSSNFGGKTNGNAWIKYKDTDTAIFSVDADFTINPADTIAPATPSKRVMSTTSTGDLNIGWDKCLDTGNIYQYKASLWNASTNAKMYDCVDANSLDDPRSKVITVDSTSGTAGYYYIYTTTNTTYDLATSIKNSLNIGGPATGTGIVPGQTVNYITTNNFVTPRNTQDMYVYVAAVDFAGNISGTYKMEVPLAYEISINPNGGVYKGSTTEVQEMAPFGTSITIPNPTREGFTFIGWDIAGMDSDVHYYDTTTATTSSPHSNATSLDHNTITSNIKAFMDLRHSAGKVTFVAIWKDTTGPILDEKNHGTSDCAGSSGENGIRYTIKEDGSNPDGTLYATFTTSDGDKYTPGTWTNKSVVMDVKLYDATGFSRIENFVNGQACPTNDNSAMNSLSGSGYLQVTYTAGGGMDPNQYMPADYTNSGISISYTIPSVVSITGRQHASDTVSFTASGKYSGKVSATDNAGDANYLKDIRNWIPNNSNLTSSFDYGQILIDKEVPTGIISYSTEDWTNEDVTVTITAQDRLSGLHSNAYSWDHGATWTSDNTHVFEEMVADYVYVRDAVGNWVKIGYKVGNIDKYEPWTDDIYHKHSTEAELHEWQNDAGGIEFSYTSKDIADPGSSSKASGISQMILFKSDETFAKGDQLTEVHSEYIAPSMSIDDTNGENFVYDETPLEITWVDDVQGTTYYVLETYDRAGNVTTVDLIYKWDVTPPVIEDPYVHQTSLDEFTEDDVEDAIKNELYCYFNYLLSDYNRSEFAPDMTDPTDSSGIDEIVIVLENASDRTQSQEIKFSAGEIGFLTSWTSRNPEGRHEDLEYTANAENYKATGDAAFAADEDAILKGYIGMKLNTYATFPDWAAIHWIIYAVDAAGNSTNDNSTSLENGLGEEIKNFSIKTVIYSDELFDNGDSLNIKDTDPMHISNFNFGNNTAYFRTGDVGHITTWTVGYVDGFVTNFEDVGESTVIDISDGKLLPKYNLGINNADFKRAFHYSIGESLTARPNNAAGVPYATKYNIEGWWDYYTKNSSGTSVRISPYYELQPIPGQFKSDGTPKYQSETHTYSAIAEREGWTDSSSGVYVIWDSIASEIHHRVTHEHHGSVTQTVE